MCGAVEQARTAEPLPYQGSALPTELRQRINIAYYKGYCMLCQALFKDFMTRFHFCKMKKLIHRIDVSK